MAAVSGSVVGAPSVGDALTIQFQFDSTAIQFGPISGSGSFTVTADRGGGVFAVGDLLTTFTYIYSRFDGQANTTVLQASAVSYQSSAYYSPSPLVLSYDSNMGALRIFNLGTGAFESSFSLRATTTAPYAYMSDDQYQDLTISSALGLPRFWFNNSSSIPSFPATLSGRYLVAAPVPEPSSALVIAVGGAFVIQIARRRATGRSSRQ